MQLHVIVASTREGRVGRPVAEWFLGAARAHGTFAVDLVDLKEVNLPLLDEPKHPRRQHYHHEHTKAWSAIVRKADAYVFVTPEYNHGAAPALVNALNYVFVEWNYKPAGFVSYGGISGHAVGRDDRDYSGRPQGGPDCRGRPYPVRVEADGGRRLYRGGRRTNRRR